jgi:hypothetical protein
LGENPRNHWQNAAARAPPVLTRREAFTWYLRRSDNTALLARQVWGLLPRRVEDAVHASSPGSSGPDDESHCGAKRFTASFPRPLQSPSASQQGNSRRRRATMTIFVFAALTVTAAIWAITAPQSSEDLTMDEISQLIVLGFVP